MAAKRSRLGRSSSSGDTTLFSAPIFESKDLFRPIRFPPPPSLPDRKRSPVNERPSIFTIDSHVDQFTDSDGEGLKVGNFLEKCCFCRKAIAEDEEVFMYWTLQAYCTYECREKQIAADREREKQAASPKRKVTGKRVGLQVLC